MNPNFWNFVGTPKTVTVTAGERVVGQIQMTFYERASSSGFNYAICSLPTGSGSEPKPMSLYGNPNPPYLYTHMDTGYYNNNYKWQTLTAFTADPGVEWTPYGNFDLGFCIRANQTTGSQIAMGLDGYFLVMQPR